MKNQLSSLLLAQRLHQTVGIGIGVPHPMEGRGPAALARQRQRAGGAGDVDLLEIARDLLHRQRGAGVRHVHDQLNTFGVVPTPRDRGGDVRLVLMVAADRLDRLAEHRPAHLLDRHSGARQRARTALVGEIARHVVEHADGDGCRLGLRMQGRGGAGQHASCRDDDDAPGHDSLRRTKLFVCMLTIGHWVSTAVRVDAD